MVVKLEESYIIVKKSWTVAIVEVFLLIAILTSFVLVNNSEFSFSITKNGIEAGNMQTEKPVYVESIKLGSFTYLFYSWVFDYGLIRSSWINGSDRYFETRADVFYASYVRSDGIEVALSSLNNITWVAEDVL